MSGRDPLHTAACRLFGVRYPIVQTGMGWVSGARLTAATAAAGGLGILAAATMTYDELAQAIDKVRERTSAPFGVNLRADQADVKARVDLLVDRGVRVASFAGPPNRKVIDRLKSEGIVTMPTIGAPKHADKMMRWGVDALIAQGGEGGGHTGSVPTSLLLPAVCKNVDVPVLGAGGFRDGRGLVAALAWGASGIAMGTRFLLTAEARVPDGVKETYVGTGIHGTVVTNHVDGYPQRVIRTPLIQRLEKANPVGRLWRAFRHALAFRKATGARWLDLVREGLAMRKSGNLTWNQLAMAPSAPMMTRAALVDGRPEAGVLPTGQVVGLIDELPTVAALVERVMNEARTTLAELAGGVS